MLAAIYGDLIGRTTIRPLALLCSTGNCTFPTFTSLGFRSECCQVRAEATRTCNANGNVLTCNYTLLNSIIVQSINFLPHQLRKIFPWPAQSTPPSASCNMKALKDSIASFGALDLVPLTEIRAQQATLCALLPCSYPYNIKVPEGTPSDSVLTSWRNNHSNAYMGRASLNGIYVVISDAQISAIPSEVLQIRDTIPILSTRSNTAQNYSDVQNVLAPTTLSPPSILSFPTSILIAASRSLLPALSSASTSFPFSIRA